MQQFDYSQYFSFLSILPALLWLLIFMVIGFFIRNNNRDKPHYKYYLWNLYAKLGFSMLFAIAYLVILGGGDTIAYFDGAVTMNNLFFKSPTLYIWEMTHLPNPGTVRQHFDFATGYPPGWIYREPEAWFVCKIMSIFSFVTLKSYLAMTLIMGYITSVVTWKLFLFLRTYEFNTDRMLAFAILLLPSVNFWCSGVSKDTIVFISLCVMLTCVFRLMKDGLNRVFLLIIAALIAGYFILHIRPFILMAFMVPFIFALITRIVKYFGGNNIFLVIIRSIVIIAGVAFIGNALIVQSEEDFLESNDLARQASVIQSDFKENEIYGDKKYELDVEFTPVGLVVAAPMTILTGILRPFIWEALSPSLIFNGIESVLFIFLIFRFIRRDFIKKLRFIQANEFLIFCVIFVLLIAYMTGLTSILFGVLVRLRAPLLPFLFVLLALDLTSSNLKKTSTIDE